MTIKLIDVAKNYRGFRHQDEALEWLEDQLTAEQLDGFASRYRNKNTEQKTTQEINANTWEGVLAAAKTAGAKFPECVAAQCALDRDWETI